MSPTRTIVALLLMTSVLFLGASAVRANLITNGGFEIGPPLSGGRDFVTIQASEETLEGWKVVDFGSVDRKYTSYWSPAAGEWSLDLSGDCRGGITSIPFATFPGLEYEVVFSLSGNFEDPYATWKTLEVSADGQTARFWFEEFDGWSTTNMGWREITWTFMADDESASLTFISYAYCAYGPVLDNVRVNALSPPGAIPLPPGVLLLGTGLLCLVGFGRFRKR
jgi:choice-of-anchor C domain-containing protein